MEIPKDHKAALFHYSETERVMYFQKGVGLAEDGIYGPLTAALLDEYIAEEFPEEPGPPFEPSIEKAFDSALEDEGEHEVPMGSNRGPYLSRIRLEAELPVLGGGQWCGVFQTVHCNRAGIDVSSRGAPAIVRQMIALPRGREVMIADITDGFYGMALHRRPNGTHHVNIFRAYEGAMGDLWIHSVGGNEGHKVNSEHQPAAEFFRGVIQVATYV